MKCIWLLPLTLVACQATPDRSMSNTEVEVCGARVDFVLPSSGASEPSVRPKSLECDRLRNPGDHVEFVRAMYDFRGSKKREVDGSVVVVGSAMRRTAMEEAEGISMFDARRLIQRMQEAGSDFQYDTETRAGRTWIKRAKLRDVAPGDGRNVEFEWLVPLAEDTLLIFRVTLSDYATAKSNEGSWYASAQRLQEQIFESLRVHAK